MTQLFYHLIAYITLRYILLPITRVTLSSIRASTISLTIRPLADHNDLVRKTTRTQLSDRGGLEFLPVHSAVHCTTRSCRYVGKKNPKRTGIRGNIKYTVVFKFKF